jgi:hypothetical protein
MQQKLKQRRFQPIFRRLEQRKSVLVQDVGESLGATAVQKRGNGGNGQTVRRLAARLPRGAPQTRCGQHKSAAVRAVALRATGWGTPQTTILHWSGWGGADSEKAA